MIQLKDGLYIVNHANVTAGFVVREGKVTVCAPVLRKNIDFFARKAKWVATDVTLPPPVLKEAIS
jgi:hypothetical protein